MLIRLATFAALFALLALGFATLPGPSHGDSHARTKAAAPTVTVSSLD